MLGLRAAEQVGDVKLVLPPECGEEIGEGRLKAMPYAEFCVTCQTKRDPAKTATRKKLTDYT